VRVLGLDIGGANVKAATADGESVSVVFPIWENKDGLRTILQNLNLLKEATPEIVALTMTAELADCFSTKAEGVEFIVRVVMDVYPNSIIRVWLTSGEFADSLDAIELPELVGASNWHALATWAGRAVPTGPALLVDVGSTTTDIVPLIDGLPVPAGRTDLERLAASELRYTGVRRTPVCAIVQSVPLLTEIGGDGSGNEIFVPVAAEIFATALDVHLLNGDISVNASDTDTADGRPATRAASLNRLAHMLCCDTNELSEQQLLHIAAYVAEQQLDSVCAAVRTQCNYLQTFSESRQKIQVLLSGNGAWLAERAIQKTGESSFSRISNLSEMFVRNISNCAPAFAVARLAAERCLDDLLPVQEWLEPANEPTPPIA